LPRTRAERQRRYRERAAVLREFGVVESFSELAGEVQERVDILIEAREARRAARMDDPEQAALWSILNGGEELEEAPLSESVDDGEPFEDAEEEEPFEFEDLPLPEPVNEPLRLQRFAEPVSPYAWHSRRHRQGFVDINQW
jgi:hypothetical protein